MPNNGTYHGDDVLNVGRPAHLNGDDAMAEALSLYGNGEREISDACAVTIASRWQGPARPALAFAELATSGTVRLEDLADAMSELFNEPANSHLTPNQRTALNMLATWALNHPSRGRAPRPRKR